MKINKKTTVVNETVHGYVKVFKWFWMM